MSSLNLVNVGLVVIALSWLVQLYQIVKVNKNISPVFVFGYMVGVGMLLVNGWLVDASISYFELATLIAAAIVFVVILRKK